jgi:16S rRNA processing protein RimM
MIKQEDVYKIGKLGKPHGVKGEVSFQFTDDVFDRVEADYLILDIDGILVPFFIEDHRFHGEETALVKFCDIDSQDKARELTGCEVFFPRKLSDSAEEEVAWNELIGYTLTDAKSDKTIGTITSIDDSTLNLLFEIKTEDNQERLIPASEDLIEDIDTKGKTIRINLPEGILDL